MTRADDRATAHHEAGHALAAYVLGLESVGTSIEPDDDTLGRHTWNPPTIQPDADVSAEDQDRIFRWIVMSLAGPRAEQLATGRLSRTGANGDYHRWLDLAGYITSSDAECSALVRWLDIRARALVRTHRTTTRAIADGLLSHRTLRAEEIAAIIQERPSRMRRDDRPETKSVCIARSQARRPGRHRRPRSRC